MGLGGQPLDLILIFLVLEVVIADDLEFVIVVVVVPSRGRGDATPSGLGLATGADTSPLLGLPGVVARNVSGLHHHHLLPRGAPDDLLGLP